MSARGAGRMSRAQLDMLRVGDATFIKVEFRKLLSYLDPAYNSCHKFRDEVRPAYTLNDSQALQLYSLFVIVALLLESMVQERLSEVLHRMLMS